MNKSVMAAAFAVGLAVVGWVGWGFWGSPLALGMTVVIAAAYLVGTREVVRMHAATASLSAALAALQQTAPADLAAWLEGLHPSLRDPIRQRVDGERVPLPGPALAPYLVGLLVMLGMLGTFLGMVLTFNGAVFALEASSSLESIRAALAAPIKGLGLSFGTSVAGVATSAMLGLMLALTRRERLRVVRNLDACIATVLRPFSAAHKRQGLLDALQAQAQAMPLIADRLQGLLEGLERRQEQLGDQLREQQRVFHQEATSAYTQLASAVGASLHDSLGSSVRMAGEAIRPVVEQAMTGLTQEAERSHQRLRETTDAQLRALSAQWEGTARAVAGTWTDALQRHELVQGRQAAQLDAALQAITQAVEQRTLALLTALQDNVAHSQAAQTAADQQRLALWTRSAEETAGRVTAQWERAGTQTAQQQQDVCRALEEVAGQLGQSLQAATHALEVRTAAVVDAVRETAAQAQAAQLAADQERLARWHQSLEGLATSLAVQWQRAGEQAAQQQLEARRMVEDTAAQLTERVTSQVHQTLGSAAQLMEQSDALLRARIDSEARWAEAQAQRMDALAGVWGTEMAALRDAEAARAQAAVARLDTLQAAVAGHLASLGAALEAPLTRLLQTAADVPQAAAEVITQLRHEMAQLSERDNAALAERTAMMEQLGRLLQAVSEAAGQQRTAIESLVGSAAAVLEQAGQEFAQALGAQAGKVDDVSAHVAASAVELSSLGASFHHGVGLFNATSEKLVESLQRIEGAIGQSLTRSDEQLAYYVAQAREVIDLSISSQQGIVEDLRRLNGQMAAAVQGVAA